MKHSLAMAAFLSSGLVLAAAAQLPSAPVPAGSAKIAVIAFQAAVSQTNEFQRNFADLEKKYDPKRQELKTLTDEIDTLQKQLQAQADKLGDPERASRAKIIDDKQKQAQRMAQDAQTDYQADMQEMFNGVAAKVGDLMVSYAQQQGYTLVLDAGQQQAPVVLYASDSTNITKAVIDAYNLKSGIPAPPAQPAGTAPRPSATAPKPAAKPVAKPVAKPAAAH